jgi:hypothetical protein
MQYVQILKMMLIEKMQLLKIGGSMFYYGAKR